MNTLAKKQKLNNLCCSKFFIWIISWESSAEATVVDHFKKKDPLSKEDQPVASLIDLVTRHVPH